MASTGINAEESNAIRGYAYAKGEYKKLHGRLIGLGNKKKALEKQLAETNAALADTEAQYAEALARLKEAKKGMAKTVPFISEAQVRAIVATPKIHTVKWGDYNRELCTLLQTATAEPISMRFIMQWFAKRFDISLETPEDRADLRDRLGKRLRELAKKGVIRRLPTEKASHMAYWVWVGLE